MKLGSLAGVTASLFALALSFGSPVSARPGYCGPTTDTSAIQKLVLADFFHHKKDRSWITNIAVAGTFAEAGVEFKGEEEIYFHHTAGHWRPYTGPIPAPADAALKRLAGDGSCANPNFVEHPSG